MAAFLFPEHKSPYILVFEGTQKLVEPILQALKIKQPRFCEISATNSGKK